MSEHEKAEAAAPSLDPRTVEVLRFLDRAKGTIAKTQSNPNIDATAQSLDSTARVLERVVTMAGERLADFQRGQDGAVRELRASVDGLIRQADVLASWRAWWTRRVAIWGMVLALVFAAGIALAWRAHALGVEHPRHSGADPREPDQGTGRQGPPFLDELRTSLQERLASTGGRPTVREWQVVRKTRFSKETWQYLARLADQWSQGGASVSPSQVAARIVEEVCRAGMR